MTKETISPVYLCVCVCLCLPASQREKKGAEEGNAGLCGVGDVQFLMDALVLCVFLILCV